MKLIYCLLFLSLVLGFTSCKSSGSSSDDDLDGEEYAEEESQDQSPETNVLKEYIHSPQDKAMGARKGIENKHKAMLEAVGE